MQLVQVAFDFEYVISDILLPPKMLKFRSIHLLGINKSKHKMLKKLDRGFRALWPQ